MSKVERCGYCGRFMAEEFDTEWGERWVCSQQDAHILADPEHWSVLTYALGDDAVDTDGEPIAGNFVGAHRLTVEQLRVALGMPATNEETNGMDRTGVEADAAAR